MSTTGPGNCDTSKSEVGNNGLCYAYCPSGWSPIDNGPLCAKNCPPGYGTAASTQDSSYACLKPSFLREIKPMIQCPVGADRQYDKCILDCPKGTSKNFNLCVPDCPIGFVGTPDGLSCQAEFSKRTATVREACYANETRIAGRVCLGPCPTATVPLLNDSELCYSVLPPSSRPFFWAGDSSFLNDVGPIIAKVIFARTQSNATCPDNFESLNGQCFSMCPTGSSALATECVADCPSGFKSVNNQSACLRPSFKRDIVVSKLAAIGEAIKKLFYGILLIMMFSFLSSLF